MSPTLTLPSLPRDPCPTCAAFGTPGWLPKNEALGRELRDLREAAGVEQKEVARRLGLSVSYVCRLEQGTGKNRWTPELVAAYEAAVQGDVDAP